MDKTGIPSKVFNAQFIFHQFCSRGHYILLGMNHAKDSLDRGLYPDENLHPYYIVAPPYTRYSAGVKSLHLLCHSLNLRGQQAFMILLPDLPIGLPALNPNLLTPRLTQDIADNHLAAGRCPVVVYPESISGNPMRAPLVVRYVLNFPGLLGGEKTYPPEDILFGFSSVLAKSVGQPDNALFVPVVNINIFRHSVEAEPRSGSCFYAKKFKDQFPNGLFEQTKDSIEITFQYSLEEMADIFRRCEYMYCYENTAVALEAQLCGCPVVFLPNPHLTDIIGTSELGREGYAWGDSPEQLEWAKRSVHKVYENYLETQDRFWKQLDHFMNVTQKAADGRPFVQPLRFPFPRASKISLKFRKIIALVRMLHWRGGGNTSVVKEILRVLHRNSFSNLLKRL